MDPTAVKSAPRLLLLLLMLIVQQLPLRSQTDEESKAYVDQWDSLILNQSISSRIVADSLGRAGFYNTAINEEGFLYFLGKLNSRIVNEPTLEDEYMVANAKVEWYAAHARIANALVAADAYKTAAGFEPSLQQQIDINYLYGRSYWLVGMYKEFMPYKRAQYYLELQLPHTEQVWYELTSSYSWALNQTGWTTRDTVLLDSSLYFKQQVLAYQEKELVAGRLERNKCFDNWNTNLLVLARRKKYNELVVASQHAYAMANQYGEDTSWLYKDQVSSFLAWTSRGFAGLKMRDSAFYYYDKAEALKPGVFNPVEGKPFLHAQFGEYDKAAELLNVMLFSRDSITEYYWRGYLYARAAPIFEKAAMYKEASICYRRWQTFQDSLQKEEDKIREESERTSTELRINEAKNFAKLQQEKLEAEAEQKQQQQTLIIVGVAILATLFLIFLLVMYNRVKITRRQNKIIEEQKSRVDEAYGLLELKNSEVLDSITYAQRIQQAILPDLKRVKQLLPGSFIFYRPKDIVAGDFYWMEKSNESVLIAAADCTGHGVPGAFMSMIASKELKIASNVTSSPAELLSSMNGGVKETLQQHHEDSTRDSIDIAVLSVAGSTIKFSGANRPLWIVKKGVDSITEIKGAKTSVAGTTSFAQQFTEHTLQLAQGDMLYIFSDGYADQFGGEKKKKMTTRRFREQILKASTQSIEEQEKLLSRYFDEWKGSLEQVDDVLVIGIRI